MDLCEAYRRLADDEDMQVREKVAGNQNLPSSCACDILTKLADDTGRFTKKNKEDNAWGFRSDSNTGGLSKKIVSYSIKADVISNSLLHSLPCACDIFMKLAKDMDVGPALVIKIKGMESTIDAVPKECREQVRKIAKATWSNTRGVDEDYMEAEHPMV